MLGIFLWYGQQKYDIMSEYDDTSIMMSEKEYRYTDDDIHTDTYGFNVAFGITSYDGNKENIEDPDYGTVKAFYRQWGILDSGSTKEFEIETRPCTYADFGMDENGELIDPDYVLKDRRPEDMDPDAPPKFFPVSKPQIDNFRTYGLKMHCFDKKLRLQGIYDSFKARNLALMFVKCDPKLRSTCKSEEEINRWIAGKFFILAENTFIFRQHIYDENKLTGECLFKWLAMSSQVRQETAYLFTRCVIEFQDSFL